MKMSDLKLRAEAELSKRDVDVLMKHISTRLELDNYFSLQITSPSLGEEIERRCDKYLVPCLHVAEGCYSFAKTYIILYDIESKR